MIFTRLFSRQNGVGSLQSRSWAITDEEREQVEAQCPKCCAQPGYWCLNAGGMPASVICPERVKAVSG